MMTYLLLNIVFILIVCLIFGIRPQRPTGQSIMVFAILIALTIVFDSVLVYFDIVEYTSGHILGLYIGFAPLEDYFYPLLAVLLVPFLWKKYDGKYD